MKLLFATIFILFSTTAIFFAFRPQTEKIAIPDPQPAPTSTNAKALTPTQTPTPEPPKPKPVVKLPLDVPFTSQAPFAQWSDPRQQDACEEAAVLMAMKWVRGEKIASKGAALAEILALSKFQEEKYGGYHDTSAPDTVKRLFNDYYHYFDVEVKTITDPQEIVSQLELSHLIIAPMNGQALENPHFTQPGPQRHNIVVKGYDKTTKEFITNDPGIREGENYRYPQDLFFAAIRDYSTGDHLPIVSVEKRMIIVSN